MIDHTKLIEELEAEKSIGKYKGAEMAYSSGYNDAIDDAIAIVKKHMGDASTRKDEDLPPALPTGGASCANTSPASDLPSGYSVVDEKFIENLLFNAIVREIYVVTISGEKAAGGAMSAAKACLDELRPYLRPIVPVRPGEMRYNESDLISAIVRDDEFLFGLREYMRGLWSELSLVMVMVKITKRHLNLINYTSQKNNTIKLPDDIIEKMRDAYNTNPGSYEKDGRIVWRSLTKKKRWKLVLDVLAPYFRTLEPVMVNRTKIRKLIEACGSGDSFSGYSITEQELVGEFLPALGVKVYED